jgi:hypothetical protein
MQKSALFGFLTPLGAATARRWACSASKDQCSANDKSGYRSLTVSSVGILALAIVRVDSLADRDGDVAML